MLQLAVVFLFGLVIGSFLNVVIVRLPQGQSVISPRSRCTECSTAIAFYDNIPLLSYLLLGGKCRYCEKPISLLYPTVELLTATVFLVTYRRFGLTPELFVNLLFFSALIALTVIDLYHRVLPDMITLPLALVGLLLSYFQHPSLLESQFLESWLPPDLPWRKIAMHTTESLFGMLVGGGLWAVRFVHFKLRRIEGLGLGDIKLMVAVGAFTGWRLAWLTIFLGSLLGAVFGSLYMIIQRKGTRYELPFGTFLGIATIVSTLWGPDLIRRYFSF